ncbi:hypothetical protein CVT24_006246 [Panaeolus cyanescens]|uniref:MYND-type domain-containing protein n=1 Tax=Panaeolus cyanescens TaxID=181874 RepID=A0A409YEI3_9AGAR|nr:hypothetical protein CVT24_006246 [Panaeolus cyanescens]
MSDKTTPREAGMDVAIRAMTYVISALKNPLKPSRCARTLYFAISTISCYFQDMPQAAFPMRDTLHHTVYRFISAQRVDQNYQDTLNALVWCNCPDAKDPKSFHSLCTKWPPTTELPPKIVVRSFVSRCFAELVFALTSITTELAVKKGVSKAWPASMSDLMPFGVDEMVLNLGAWYKLFPEETLVRFILHVQKICGPVIHDAFNKYDITKVVFVDHMHQLIHHILKEPVDQVQQVLSDIVAFQGGTFLSYMTEITTGEDAIPIPMLMQGQETRTLQICSIMLYILHSPYAQNNPSFDEYLEQLRTKARTLARSLFRRYRMDQPSRSPIPLHPEIVAEDRLFRHLEDHKALEVGGDYVYSDIALAIQSFRHFYACSAPHCPSMADPERRLRSCAGCNIVRYCGKKCQTRDWKEGEFQHKRLCKTFAKITRAISAQKSSSGFDICIMAPKSEARMAEVLTTVKTMKEDGKFIDDGEFDFLLKWTKARLAGLDRDKPLPIEECEWHPGFDDYDDTLRTLTDPTCPLQFNGLKPEFMEQI